MKTVLNFNKTLTAGQKVQDLDQIKKELDLLKKAVKTAQSDPLLSVRDAALAAIQTPSEGGDCLFDSGSSCGQLIYPDGFRSVYSGLGGLPLPVPILFFGYNGVNSKALVATPEFLPCKESMDLRGPVCQ